MLALLAGIGLEAKMKRYLFNKRKKRSQILIMILLLVSILLFLRAFTLSFSDKIGQAKTNSATTLFSGIYSSIIENGSAIINYQVHKDKVSYPFPLKVI